MTCFASAAFCLVLGVPSILVGAVAASTGKSLLSKASKGLPVGEEDPDEACSFPSDWNSTSYGLPTPYERNQAGAILPIALQFLVPSYVSIIGIGAVAAAVMSSMDSALLSSASLFSSNVYKNIFRKQVRGSDLGAAAAAAAVPQLHRLLLLLQASDREMQWVIRISVVVVGLAGTGLTFLDSSVLVFWLVGVDMSYTIMFPQLVCILFSEVSNSYGAAVGLIMGIVLRVLSGEPLLGLAPVIHFPGCRLDEEGKMTQFFPFRTTIMVASMVSIWLFSWITSTVFNRGLLPDRWDVFKVKRRPTSLAHASDPTDGGCESKRMLSTTSF